METAAHHEGRESTGILSPSPHEPQPPTDALHSGLTSGPESGGSLSQEPPCAAGGEEEDDVDRISLLPDAVLGDIVSLLPTKDAARTQALASRWRRIWLSAPLNLDCRGFRGRSRKVIANLLSRILAAHPGPARRFSVSVLHLLHRPAMVDAWLSSPALNNLQVLQFHTSFWRLYHLASPKVSLPVSALRFSATLRVISIRECRFPESEVGTLQFPQLRQLALHGVKISDDSLNSIISGSPVLECLLIHGGRGSPSRSIRINSPSLVSIGLHIQTVNVIIEDAPSLEKLIHLEESFKTHVLVISAPKLQTLGYLYNTNYTFGTTELQELKANSFTTEVPSVKILAINISDLSLDTVINLTRFFPSLEKLYIQSNILRNREMSRRKHRDVVKCLDIRLNTIVWKHYRGIKSQVNCATFFVLNAKRLELMRFEVRAIDDNNHFISEQRKLLQLEKRASRCAQFYFTSDECHRYLPRINHVGDLSNTNPFECSSMCLH